MVNNVVMFSPRQRHKGKQTFTDETTNRIQSMVNTKETIAVTFLFSLLPGNSISGLFIDMHTRNICIYKRRNLFCINR